LSRSPQIHRAVVTMLIRSDIRATALAAAPVIQELLTGDVVFTNLESAAAEKGETVQEGRDFSLRLIRSMR